MHENASQAGNSAGLSALRRYCLCLSEFISGRDRILVERLVMAYESRQ